MFYASAANRWILEVWIPTQSGAADLCAAVRPGLRGQDGSQGAGGRREARPRRSLGRRSWRGPLVKPHSLSLQPLTIRQNSSPCSPASTAAMAPPPNPTLSTARPIAHATRSALHSLCALCPSLRTTGSSSAAPHHHLTVVYTAHFTLEYTAYSIIRYTAHSTVEYTTHSTVEYTAHIAPSTLYTVHSTRLALHTRLCAPPLRAPTLLAA